MLRIYCQKCGNANGYISEKPNFCQKCGHKFLENEAGASLNEENVNKNITEGTEYVPKLSGLDIEIDTGRSNTQTVEDLAGSMNSEGGFTELSRGEGDGLTAEDIMREGEAIKPVKKKKPN